MALDYDTVPNGFMIQVGSIAKFYNSQKTSANLIGPATDPILDTFNDMTADTPSLMLNGFASSIRGWQDQYTGRRITLASLSETRLTEKETMLDELGETTGQIAAVLNRLIFQMNDDAESINATVVTLATPVNNVANIGTGEILQTKLLDGRSSPGSFSGGTYPSHPEYRGINSEFALSETLQIACTADSGGGTGIIEGGETFSWSGVKADVQHGWQNEGSGNVGTIIGIHDPTLNQIFNADFEDWNANIPAGWQIVDGTPGTHILQETDIANVYHGDSSVAFVGDGVQAAIAMRSDLTVANIQGSRGMICTVRIRVSSTPVTNGLFTMELNGTGYTPVASERIIITAASLTDTFTLYHFFIILPQVIPSDMNLFFNWVNTPDDGISLYVDDIAFSPVFYGAGVGIAVVRGDVPWVLADRITIDNTTDTGGVFSTFFRQAFGFQLPSNDAGAETILDSLAT